ncbi:MAG TPA: Minichromosome maintenance protein MCM, partial [archaeon]|nr:Minichromosome maintenance protein MCM [archaeon]
EALLRMAEASAKIRLDTHVRKEDAERAIRLMMFSLRQLGFDTESGMIDIDKMEGGITTSKRKRITRLIEVIERMQKEMKEVAISDVFAEAQTLGISEKDAEETMEELVRKGELFHPKPGFVKKV